MTPTKDETLSLAELVQRYGGPEAQAELGRLVENAERAEVADEAAALAFFVEVATQQGEPTATPEQALFIQGAATNQAAYESQRRALAATPPAAIREAETKQAAYANHRRALAGLQPLPTPQP